MHVLAQSISEHITVVLGVDDVVESRDGENDVTDDVENGVSVLSSSVLFSVVVCELIWFGSEEVVNDNAVYSVSDSVEDVVEECGPFSGEDFKSKVASDGSFVSADDDINTLSVVDARAVADVSMGSVVDGVDVIVDAVEVVDDVDNVDGVDGVDGVVVIVVDVEVVLVEVVVVVVGTSGIKSEKNI